jgi:3-methyladenine DNA glycosylase AlkC
LEKEKAFEFYKTSSDEGKEHSDYLSQSRTRLRERRAVAMKKAEEVNIVKKDIDDVMKLLREKREKKEIGYFLFFIIYFSFFFF